MARPTPPPQHPQIRNHAPIPRRDDQEGKPMTDEWMRHPVTGLTAPHHATQTDAEAETVWRDRGQIIATLTARIADLEREVQLMRHESALRAAAIRDNNLKTLEDEMSYWSVLAAEPTPPAAPHAEDGALFCAESYEVATGRVVGWQGAVHREAARRLVHDLNTAANAAPGSVVRYRLRPAPVADPSGTGETR